MSLQSSGVEELNRFTMLEQTEDNVPPISPSIGTTCKEPPF